MNDMMDAFYEWLPSRVGNGGRGPGRQRGDFQRYFHGIAKARYVIRKVVRIVNDEAKKAGLDPLEHQALIQVFGSESGALQVNEVAERLDVQPALASRLIRSLEGKGYATRTPSDRDRRTIDVTATEGGRKLLAEIDAAVHVHVDYFQSQLTDLDRAAALGIFAFYLGASPGLEDFRELDALLARGEEPKRP